MHSLPLLSSTTPSSLRPSSITKHPTEVSFLSFGLYNQKHGRWQNKQKNKQTEQVEIHPYHLMSLKKVRIK